MSWGRGWQVPIQREIWAQRRALKEAQWILKSQCGTKHQIGERADLCPKCQAHAEIVRRGGLSK
jgi:hypothetical protein